MRSVLLENRFIFLTSSSRNSRSLCFKAVCSHLLVVYLKHPNLAKDFYADAFVDENELVKASITFPFYLGLGC